MDDSDCIQGPAIEGFSVKDFDVPVLGTCRIDSPVAGLLGAQALHQTGKVDRILVDNRLSAVAGRTPKLGNTASFELAGPRDKIFFDPSKTRAGIVTCGGICPGLNNVIRGIVYTLTFGYGIKRIYGFRYGYAGFIPQHKHEVMDLTPESTKDIHQTGGTILGSSRGAQDPAEIVDALDNMNVNVLFTIGGDGTQRGAMTIVDEIKKRGLKISVVGVPKTIDNDIPFIQRSFGYVTAYEHGASFIRSAKAESRGCFNGVGLVKLMGRHSGHIACNAALAQTDADFVLIPELPFDLEGDRGFLACLRRKLAEKGRAVVVVAEGAGQEHMAGDATRDPSGNLRLQDIGAFLKGRITSYCPQHDVPVSVKYMDPSYQIRSVPANYSDGVYCWNLARNAVHCAMSGNTQVVLGFWKGHFVHVPMKLATSGRQSVDPTSPLWMAVLEATGQPASMKNPAA